MPIETPTLLQPKHVLVVDDEQAIRTLLEEVLTLSGYYVTTASDGYEALARLWEQRFDLALVDLLMPGISGGEVARVIAQHFPETPVIIITGSDAATIAEELGDTPVTEVISKPFSIVRIMDLVARLVGPP